MNSPSQSMTAAHQLRVVVSVSDRVVLNAVDTTTPLVVSTNNAMVATAVVDPADSRAVLITAMNVDGGCTITVQEDPETPNPLHIPVFVSKAPDLSGVTFVSSTQI